MVDYSGDLSEFIATTLAAPWLSKPLSSLPHKLTKRQAELRRRTFLYVMGVVKGASKQRSSIEGDAASLLAEQVEETLAALATQYVSDLAGIRNQQGLVQQKIERTYNFYDMKLAPLVDEIVKLARQGVPFYLLRPERAAVMFFSVSRTEAYRRGMLLTFKNGSLKAPSNLLLMRLLAVSVFIGMLTSRGVALRLRLDQANELAYQVKISKASMARNMKALFGDRMKVSFGSAVLGYMDRLLAYSVGDAAFLQEDEMPLTWQRMNTSGKVPQRSDLQYDVARVIDYDAGTRVAKALATQVLYDRRLSFGVRQLGIKTKHGSVNHPGDAIVYATPENHTYPLFNREVLSVVDRIRSMHEMVSLDVEPATLLSPVSRETLAQVRGNVAVMAEAPEPRDIAVTPAPQASPVSPEEPAFPSGGEALAKQFEEFCTTFRPEGGADMAEPRGSGGGADVTDEHVEHEEDAAMVPAVGMRRGDVEDWRVCPAGRYRASGFDWSSMRPFSELVEKARHG